MKINKNYQQKYKNYTNTSKKWKMNKKPYWNTNKRKNIVKICSDQEYEYYFDTAKNEWGSRIVKK